MKSVLKKLSLTRLILAFILGAFLGINAYQVSTWYSNIPEVMVHAPFSEAIFAPILALAIGAFLLYHMYYFLQLGFKKVTTRQLLTYLLAPYPVAILFFVLMRLFWMWIV